MSRPAVALLTDFGTADPYVAAMKGVIRSRCDCDLIDLSHELPRGDVFSAAMFLRFAVGTLRHDGSRTIICAVVDPGVGTDRRIIAIRSRGLWFVGPDNGLFLPSLASDDVIHEVTRDDLFLAPGSRTFHGRDRFAPTAAAIASGFEVEGLGPRIAPADCVQLDYRPPEYSPDEVRGTVISVDRFGNVVTDIEPTRVSFARPWTLWLGQRSVSDEAETYEAGKGLEVYMIEGSRGTIELSVTGASAATVLQPRPRTEVSLRPASRGN